MKTNWQTAFRIEHRFAEIIQEQEERGVQFDEEKAEAYVAYLQQEMDRLYADIRPHLVPEIETKGNSVQKVFKKDGSYTKIVEDWFDTEESVGGPFTRVQFVEPNLNQQQKLKDQLLTLGWEPDEYTPVTEKGGGNNPKITEDSLDKLKTGLGQSIALWTKLRHRQSQIQGWIDNVRDDGRISALVNPCATNTARVAHKVVANPPKANSSKDGLIYYPEGDVTFGTEMRSLFTVAPGRKLVGCDAAGLEARILAHYMNDEWFTRELLEGDIHTKMWESCDPWVDTRSTMKNCFYAYIFGAGHYRLGVTANFPSHKAAEAGKKIDEGIRWALPSLAELNDNVKKAAKRGWLKAIDGRKVWLRRDNDRKIMEHKALNTLIQSAGSIATKVAMCHTAMQKDKEGLDGQMVIYMHDEGQFDVLEEHAEAFAEVVENSFVRSAEFLNLRVPLAGESIIGDNWAITH